MAARAGFSHHTINDRKIGQIGQIDVQFDDISQRSASRCGNGGQVAEDLANLLLNLIADDLSTQRIQWYLSGQVDGIAKTDGL